MTVNNFEHQNRDFVNFLAILACATYFKSEWYRNRQR